MAFDTVRHSALAQKLSSLELPDSIYNWLVEFLQDRTHSTLFAGRRSPAASINASIIQGSGLGPSEYVVSASDLHLVHGQNRISKFADDTYLIIPSSMRHTTDEELGAVRKWATVNIFRLLYASPAWWGLTSAEDRARLESFLKNLRRHQFLSSSVGSFESMADAADVRLLRAVVASDAHVLRQFFPPVQKGLTI